MTNILVAIAVFVGLASQALAGKLVFINHCRDNIWALDAMIDGGTYEFWSLVPGHGGNYTSSMPANNDNVGAVLSLADVLDDNGTGTHPLNLEVTVQHGVSRVNLFAPDFDPFLNYHRHVEIPEVC